MSRLPAFVSTVGIVALAACARTGGSDVLGAPTGAVSINATSQNYIKHVVIIVQENRTFDNLFATFPGADGATSGYYLKKVTGGYQKTLIQLTQRALAGDFDIYHTSQAYNLACDGKDTYPKTSCDMDGFNLEPLNDKTLAGKYPYMYVKPADIKPYWDMAKQYGLGDHLFQTQGSGSFTAHLDLVAGGTAIDKNYSLIDFPTEWKDWGCGAPTGTTTAILTTSGKFYLNGGPFPCLTYSTKTMRDLLDAAKVSWKYYTPPYISGKIGAEWDAFAAISDVYNDPYEWGTNVSWPETNIFTDLDNNALPAVSWVIPESANSDHPWGKGSQDNGPSWVASVVNAIGKSSAWKSTAIVIVWDDFGGFFDHEPPPFFDDAGGLGFRVPLIVVSPYAPKGEITHTQYEFASILKFVEQNFNLGSMHTTDDRATSIVDMLNFTQKPRKFKTIQAPLSKQYFLHEKHVDQPMDDE